jgi:GT2 family glycosyltransferase
LRQPLSNWKDLLDENAPKLIVRACSGLAPMMIDVVVPSFRTPVDTLRRIMAMEDPPTCSLKFIIIVDNPDAPNLSDVIALQSERVRVRVNDVNLGASASWSRGLAEACAEWVLLLDDDVVPSASCVQAYVSRIREAGGVCCGFVGTTCLPPVQAPPPP